MSASLACLTDTSQLLNTPLPGKGRLHAAPVPRDRCQGSQAQEGSQDRQRDLEDVLAKLEF